MIVEGVNFIGRVCLGMTKEEFVERHMVFFQDRDEGARKKLLEKIYARMKKEIEK